MQLQYYSEQHNTGKIKYSFSLHSILDRKGERKREREREGERKNERKRELSYGAVPLF